MGSAWAAVIVSVGRKKERKFRFISHSNSAFGVSTVPLLYTVDQKTMQLKKICFSLFSLTFVAYLATRIARVPKIIKITNFFFTNLPNSKPVLKKFKNHPNQFKPSFKSSFKTTSSPKLFH